MEPFAQRNGVTNERGNENKEQPARSYANVVRLLPLFLRPPRKEIRSMYHDGCTAPGAVKWRSDHGTGVWFVPEEREAHRAMIT